MKDDFYSLQTLLGGLVMTTRTVPRDDDEIVFTHFWMFKTEGGWRWVSRDTTKSSRAAFDFAPQCALDAERTLTKVQP